MIVEELNAMPITVVFVVAAIALFLVALAIGWYRRAYSFYAFGLFASSLAFGIVMLAVAVTARQAQEFHAQQKMTAEVAQSTGTAPPLRAGFGSSAAPAQAQSPAMMPPGPMWPGQGSAAAASFTSSRYLGAGNP